MRTYYLEFLDTCLRSHDASNILQENLFCTLSCAEMLAATRVGSIVDLAISQPIRWLAGKTGKLAEQGWTVACMSKAVIALEGALEKVAEDGALLLKESFILYIIEEIAEELDERMNLAERERSIATRVNFCAFLQYILLGEKVRSPDGKTGYRKGVELRRRLFHPEAGGAVAATDEMCKNQAVIVATAMLSDIRDKTKATAAYLLSTDGAMAWGTDAARRAHEATRGVDATDDAAESYWGGFTEYYNKHGTIAVASAAGVVTARANDIYGARADARLITKSRKGKRVGPAVRESASGGLMRQLTPEMRETLIHVCQSGLQADIQQDRNDLEAQHECVRRKAELAYEKARAEPPHLLARVHPPCDRTGPFCANNYHPPLRVRPGCGEDDRSVH